MLHIFCSVSACIDGAPAAAALGDAGGDHLSRVQQGVPQQGQLPAPSRVHPAPERAPGPVSPQQWGETCRRHRHGKQR